MSVVGVCYRAPDQEGMSKKFCSLRAEGSLKVDIANHSQLPWFCF